MVRLFLDIETLPASEDTKAKVISILKKKKSKKDYPVSDEGLYESTSFDGAFGRICCIGYIKENSKVEKGVLKGEEKEILKKFWELAKDVDLFIGHNAWDFDLPFIYKRSIILGVKPSVNISFVRYRNDNIFDTMFEWEKWAFGRKIALDTLAHVLDLPSSKDEMSGKDVWKYYQEGRIEDICKYCLKDVELTRQVYYRMTFGEMVEEMVEEIKEELF